MVARALFCFAESDNPLNDDLGEDQYMNITVEQELSFPDTSFLTSVLSVAQVTAFTTLVTITDQEQSAATAVAIVATAAIATAATHHVPDLNGQHIEATAMMQ